jgi:large subunit ribosomal protein L4
MKLEVLNIKGEKTGRSVELPADIFGIEPNEHVVYLAVKSYLASQRFGQHKSKERSEASGSTRKLHKQKGTGGSRKGDINSVVLGGSRTFGPKPHDYVVRLNKKVRQLARKSAFSTKAKSDSIFVVEDFTFSTPKTKEFASVLTSLGVSGKKCTFVTPVYDEILLKSSRNLPKAGVSRACDLNTYQIMNTQVLVLSEGAITKIQETFN